MFSEEHKEYIKKKRRKTLFVRIVQVSIFILFIVIWQLLSNFGLINTFIFSSPKKVIECLIDLHVRGNLYNHILITVWETTISFVLGTFIGLFIATLMWWNKTFARIIDPYLTVLNSLPKVALGPIIIIWAGAGMNSIIFMALLISVIVTIIGVYQGFIDTDPIKLKLMKSLGANKRQIYFKLILPNSLPVIISALKINVSMSLIGVIMGEFLVSKEGIGYLIMYGSQVFNLGLVITGIMILCIVAVLMYYIVLYIEKKLVRK
ncbi:MAG: ABC transporter permease [Clostridium sp.]|nr:ABC transporter permease [Clostridium sp.]MCM1444192.1 ABC transporter permease [Candidatus Amulumruptor caecigallinarius]